MTNPRVLAENILQLHREVYATSEDSDFPASNVLDLSTATKWKPSWDSTLLTNGDLLLWAGGAAAAPDSWSLVGAGASVAQDTTPKHGLYGATVTRAGADSYLKQTVTGHASYRGMVIHLGCWVRTSSAATAYLTVSDGVGTGVSSAHTGGGGWEWLTVSRTIVSNSTTLDVRLDVKSNNVTVEFTHPLALEGQAPDESPPAPETAYLNIIPGFGDGTNMLRNGYLADWADGPESDPDNWTLVGAAATAVLATAQVVIGLYSCAVTRVGNDCYIGQSISAANLELVKGKTIAIGGHVWASVGSRARLQVAITMRDSSTVWVTNDTYNDGDSDWDWEQVSVTVPHDATDVAIRCAVDTGNTTAYFDGLTLVIGATATQTPPSQTVDAFAVAGHNMGTAGLTITLEGSDDQSSWTSVVSKSPSDDSSIWYDKDTSGWSGSAAVSKRFWRVKLAGGSGDQLASIGVISFGQFEEAPEPMALGFDPYGSNMRSETFTSDGGAFVERQMKSVPRRLVMEFTWMAESELQSSGFFYELRKYAGDLLEFGSPRTALGMPFFLQWEESSHDDMAMYCRLPDNVRFEAPLHGGYNAARIALELEVWSEL